MKKILLAAAVSSATLLSPSVSADILGTAAIVSDYTFNGVSRTDNGPALQLGLDYANDSDVYVGAWASNVDFGDADDTVAEIDLYAGKYFQISQIFSLDAGVDYYSFHGDSDSSDLSYGDVYAKLGLASEFGHTEFNLWYAWDYFGSDEAHNIMMLAHSYEVAEGHTVRVSIDQSMYMDSDVKNWDGESSYVHYRLGYETNIEGFDLSVAVEDTTMDTDNSDLRLVAGISKSFEF